MSARARAEGLVELGRAPRPGPRVDDASHLEGILGELAHDLAAEGSEQSRLSPASHLDASHAESGCFEASNMQSCGLLSTHRTSSLTSWPDASNIGSACIFPDEACRGWQQHSRMAWQPKSAHNSIRAHVATVRGGERETGDGIEWGTGEEEERGRG